MQDPWLGASPDGLVYDPSASDPLGLLEIKCPFQARDTSVKDLCQQSTFFLTNRSGIYQLKSNHNYYYQVQGQMHILRRSWCDFVVYTPYDSQPLIVLRIPYDEKFWKEVMHGKLQKYYLGSMLPELCRPRYPSTKKVRPIQDIEPLLQT